MLSIVVVLTSPKGDKSCWPSVTEMDVGSAMLQFCEHEEMLIDFGQ